MTQPAAPELITLDAVRKSDNLGRPSEAEVLHGIDLQVRRGEFIALMGTMRHSPCAGAAPWALSFNSTTCCPLSPRWRT